VNEKGKQQRLPQFRNRSSKQKCLKAAWLYRTGRATQAEALWAVYLSDSKYCSVNASRAFSRNRMKRALEIVDKSISQTIAKQKEVVVKELENREEDIVDRLKKLYELYDKCIERYAVDDLAALKEAKTITPMIARLEKIVEGMGVRTDKLQGRYVKDAENPETAQMEVMKERFKSLVNNVQDGKAIKDAEEQETKDAT
jgi:RNase P protein component